MDYTSTAGGNVHHDWALLLPPKDTDVWLVCIHGHGSHGDQLYVREDLRRLWLPTFLSAHVGILTPNLRDDAWMSPAAASDLHDLVSFLRDDLRGQRFVFFSGSMGGMSNLIYPVLYPGDVTASVALGAVADIGSYHRWCRESHEAVAREIADAIESAYGGTPNEVPEVYRRHNVFEHIGRLTMPVFVAHGENDALMPVEEMRRLAEVMNDADNFAYVEIAGGNHDSPLARIDAFDWVMARLPGAAADAGGG
jgi:pimeloyl-ACP methyl ester carboxylesterase